MKLLHSSVNFTAYFRELSGKLSSHDTTIKRRTRCSTFPFHCLKLDVSFLIACNISLHQEAVMSEMQFAVLASISAFHCLIYTCELNSAEDNDIMCISILTFRLVIWGEFRGWSLGKILFLDLFPGENGYKILHYLSVTVYVFESTIYQYILSFLTTKGSPKDRTWPSSGFCIPLWYVVMFMLVMLWHVSPQTKFPFRG